MSIKTRQVFKFDRECDAHTCIPAALDGVTEEEEERLTTGVTAMVEVAAGAGEDTSCTVGSEVDDEEEREGGNISLVTSCTVIWSRNWKCWRVAELRVD